MSVLQLVLASYKHNDLIQFFLPFKEKFTSVLLNRLRILMLMLTQDIEPYLYMEESDLYRYISTEDTALTRHLGQLIH